MRLGDSGGDREAETGTAARPRTRAVGAVEALEDARSLLLGQSRPMVGDDELGTPVDLPELDGNSRAGRRVRSRVREQVVEHLAEAGLVARHRRRLDRELDRSARLDDARGVDRLADHCGEIDRLLLEGPALVETREEEQVVDEEVHPLRLARDPGHRPLEILRTRRGAAVEQLRVRTHRRQRSAKLV